MSIGSLRVRHESKANFAQRQEEFCIQEFGHRDVLSGVSIRVYGIKCEDGRYFLHMRSRCGLYEGKDVTRSPSGKVSEPLCCACRMLEIVDPDAIMFPMRTCWTRLRSFRDSTHSRESVRICTWRNPNTSLLLNCFSRLISFLTCHQISRGRTLLRRTGKSNCRVRGVMR